MHFSISARVYVNLQYKRQQRVTDKYSTNDIKYFNFARWWI